MHKGKKEQVRRAGHFGVQLAALGIAFSVFGASAVFGVDAMQKTAVYKDGDPYAGITQDGELGIAQISSAESFEESDFLEESSDGYLTESMISSESTAESSFQSDAESSVSSEQSMSSSSGTSSSRPSSQISSSKPSSVPSSSAPVSSSKPSSSPSSETDDEEQLLHIVAGAVQCEIVGTNSVPNPKYYEAYKAQAVACRSYMEHYKKTYGRYPQMSYQPPHPQTVELVRAVYNEALFYGNSPANAVYHAASGGHTQSSQYIWGGNLPYLTAVESAYDELPSSYSVSAEEAKQKLSQAGIVVSGEPETWFDLTKATYTDGGFVYTLPVCGISVKARTLREQVFGTGKLKSTKITNIAVKDGIITFSTLGYGHGAGLSQRGALGYSAAGWGYRQILMHYYKGVTLKKV